MAITLGDIFIRIIPDDSKLDSGLRGAEQKAQGWAGKVGGFLSNAASFAVGGLIERGIGAITSNIGGLASQMINSNAAFEQYETRFSTLLGSTSAAQARMAELAQFGAQTPFDLPGVVEADIVLQGFGLHSTEAMRKFGYSGQQIRTIAGDVASGTGADFKEMALLIGKFSAGSTGEAIMRMQELGITNREEMTKMGLQFDKSGQLLSPLPQAMNVVLQLMEKKYGGLMEAQSKTFEGMMSNLRDWSGNALRVIGKPVFELMKDKLKGLLEFLSSPAVMKAIDTFAGILANGIGVAVDWISKTAWPALMVIVNWVGTTGWPMLQGIIGWISSVAAPIFQSIVGTIEGLITSAGGLVEAFKKGGLAGLFAELGVQLEGPGGLGERIKMIIENLPGRIADLAVEYGPKIGQMLADMLFGDKSSYAQGWEQMLREVFSGKTSVIDIAWGDYLPIGPALEAGANLAAAVVQGIITSNVWEMGVLGTLTEKLNAWVNDPGTQQSAGEVGGSLGQLVGQAIMGGIGLGITSGASGNISTKIGEIFTNLMGSISGIRESGVQFAQEFLLGLIGAILGKDIAEKIGPQFRSAFTAMANALAPDFYKIGTDIIAGIAKGIKDAGGDLMKAASKVGEDLVQAFRDAISSHSPSVKFMEIGADIMAGLQIGLNQNPAVIPAPRVDSRSFNLTINTSAGAEPLLGDFAAMQAMIGA